MTSLVLLPTAATAGWIAGGTGEATMAAPALTNASALQRTACGSKSKQLIPITLSWSLSAHQGVKDYVITRTGGGFAPATIIMAAPDTATPTDRVPASSGAQATITYSYTIRARSGNWMTAESAPLSVVVRNETCA